MKSIKYKLQLVDLISTLRNWIIVNAIVLLAFYDKLQAMFVEWNFDLVEIRKMIVISVFSFIAFSVKRFFIGEKTAIDKK